MRELPSQSSFSDHLQLLVRLRDSKRAGGTLSSVLESLEFTEPQAEAMLKDSISGLIGPMLEVIPAFELRIPQQSLDKELSAEACSGAFRKALQVLMASRKQAPHGGGCYAQADSILRFAYGLAGDRSPSTCLELLIAPLLVQKSYGPGAEAFFMTAIWFLAKQHQQRVHERAAARSAKEEARQREVSASEASVSESLMRNRLEDAVNQAQASNHTADDAVREAERWRQIVSPLASFPFDELRRLVWESDWMAPTFTAGKALACALISKLAYLHVASAEVEGAPRFKLIPSYAYQVLAKTGLPVDVRQFVRFEQLGDGGEAFVIETADAILVGLAFPQVVLVGVRGTQSLYDAYVDVKAWKKTTWEGMQFHSGFFHAAQEGFEPLRQAIQGRIRGGRPVCFAGHSLGAAMAAICHGQWESGEEKASQFRHCYAFACPRYAGREAVARLRRPFHLYGRSDPVPGLPPRWLGFSDMHFESAIDGSASSKSSFANGVRQAIIAKLSGNGMSHHHAMETYLGNVRKNAQALEAGRVVNWRAF